MSKFDFQKLATALNDIPMMDVLGIYLDEGGNRIRVHMMRPDFVAAFPDHRVSAYTTDNAELSFDVGGVTFFCLASYAEKEPELRALEPLKVVS